MSKIFAEIDGSGKVLRVILASSKEWCESNFHGTWVQTYKNRSDKNYAGIGFIYHPFKDNFSTVQPFISWSLGNDCKWKPPTPIPELTQEEIDAYSYYDWDESSLEWVLKTNETSP